MFIGEFTGAHTQYCDVYQAILLPHAIADLEADHPNHVSELYYPRQTPDCSLAREGDYQPAG